MPIDFIATAPQYAHHLRPVYDALPDELRGEWRSEPEAAVGVRRAAQKRRPLPTLVAVSSWGDYKRASLTCRTGWAPVAPTVLFEHGVGLSYNGSPRTGNASYAGGPGRERAVCMPATNEYVAAANRLAYPNVPTPIIGCPKMDELARLPRPANAKPVVCVSFHWDCHIAPETRWAFPEFWRDALALAERTDIEVIAHGHPRIDSWSRRWWGQRGVEYVPHFADVCARADVYVIDNSSTLYEFAALDRPTVAMNPSYYRRHVNHGLRFWENVPGVQCDRPADLSAAVDIALDDSALLRNTRAAVTAAVYPHLGESTARAAALLADLHEAHA